MQTIAIPVEENRGLDSPVSSHFGDGKHYLLVEVEGGEVRGLTSRAAPGGDCSKWKCRANRFLDTLSCDVVIAPRLGDRAREILLGADIEVTTGEGRTAREVLESYLDKGLSRAEVNRYCPHSNEGMYTAAAHAGGMDPHTGAVMPPIYQTSTFAVSSVEEGAERFAGRGQGFVYTRMGNPTVRALEDTVAQLEGGYAGLATSTGMAAVVTTFMSLLGRDLHVVSTDSVYGPSRGVLENELARYGVQSSFVNTADLDAVEAAMRPNTRVLYIETPSNPTIKLADIAACAEIAHDHDALLVVDNTFMTPFLQRPFERGADVIVHSMTKALNGHSDVVAGMILTRDKHVYTRIRKTLLYMGGTIDPHQAYLVIRGIRTLPLRVERAQQNAMAIAEYLEAHPKVSRVLYTGLRSHPQYDLAARQMMGPGSIISFEMKGGLEAGKYLLNHVKVPALAVSLGGVESLIQHPASMTHAGLSREDREAAGITDGLVRFSVGCETLSDLTDDLEQALAGA